MAGSMDVEKTITSFPLSSHEDDPRVALAQSGLAVSRGTQHIDLYSRLKSLERQLEFLEIRVRVIVANRDGSLAWLVPRSWPSQRTALAPNIL
jgi:hypothetical protein